MASVIQTILANRNDYYKVLNVPRTATIDEIKRQYKRRALETHPDKNTGVPNANEAFQLVNTAHSTLTDPQKRAVYDRHGKDGVSQFESGGGTGGGGGGGRGPYYQHRQNQQFQHPFEEFFFSQFTRQHPRRPGQQQGGGGGGGPEMHFQGEANINLFMLLPVLMFILLAMMLQTNVSDSSSSSYGGSAYGASQRNKQNLVNAFSLVPKYDEQMTTQRTTAHPLYRDLSVAYYVSRQWNDYANRGYIDIRATELEVLKKHRDSLGRKCESEALRSRSKGSGKKGAVPEVCGEYDTYRDRIRS